MFENILGNDPLKAYLRTAVHENRLPQTMLFSGPEGVGKGLFAQDLACELLGPSSHDLHVLTPEGKSGLYAIDTLREMIDKEHGAAYEARGKIFILEDAERMQPAAANALLKTLEEPTQDTTFILLSSAAGSMLPTILSRCTLLHFQPLTEAMIEKLLSEKNLPVHFAKYAHGSAGRAFELAQQPELEEQRCLLFRLLAERPSYPETMLCLEKIESLLKTEEDPIRSNRQAEHLFAYILMWHRDQHARQVGAKLFFPEEAPGEPISLKKVESNLEKARLAFGRNMKLSFCLRAALGLD